ncbi:MAG: hypothetical protein QM754_12240 [Tepidisphaeraceae bacterium]
MRIGQILSQTVPLSEHDVEEILQEQHVSRQRFGDAALALGKVRPQQVWEAWIKQLRETPIDLDRVTPDSPAIDALPRSAALALKVLPLRLRGNELVVAFASENSPDLNALERATGYQVIAIAAKSETIARTLAKFYPAVGVSAA